MTEITAFPDSNSLVITNTAKCIHELASKVAELDK